MSIIKKSISILLCLALVLGSALMIASADSGDSYRENARWTEITKSEADSKFNSGEKFIVVFFVQNNVNCNSVGNNVLSVWMDTYSYNIYGVDGDNSGVSQWVYDRLKTTAITYPVVCFVEGKDAAIYSGAEKSAVDGMKAKFYDFAGLSPETTYKLIYDANGGANAPDSIIDNGPIALSTVTPNRDGYKFLGWSKSPSATVANYSAGANFTLSEDTTLYAVWQKYDGPASYSFGVVYHQSEARKMLDMINQFRQSGNAWYWNDDNTTKTTQGNLSKLEYDYELEKAAMQRAAEIVAKFEHTRPNDELVLDMFTGGSKSENIAYGQESAAKAEEAFEEAGKMYEGQGHRRNILNSSITAVGIACVEYEGRNYWVQLFRSPKSNASYTTPADTAADVTVEILNKYITSVTVTPDVSSIDLNVGLSAPLPTLTQYVKMNCDPKNTLVGLRAADWRCDDPSIAKVVDDEVIAVREGSTILRGNYGGGKDIEVRVTVEANPGPAQYILQYDANGGSKAPANQSGNGEIEIAAAVPERSGYTFLGWSFSQTADSPQFNPGGKFDLSAPATLFAVWRKNPSGATYTLTFDLNGGSNGPANRTGSGYITLPENRPVKSKYTFLGWGTLKESATVKYEPGDKYNLDANATLYAIWEEGGDIITPIPDEYCTLTYNANGGTNAPAAQKVKKNSSTNITTSQPSWTGHAFLGWAESATATEKKYSAGDKITLTKNLTLYALWTGDPIKGHGTLTISPDSYTVYVGKTTSIAYTVTNCNEDYMIIVESENNEIAYVSSNNADPQKTGKFLCTGAKEGKIMLTVSLRNAKNGDVYDIKVVEINVKTEDHTPWIVRVLKAIGKRINTYIIEPIRKLYNRIKDRVEEFINNH